MKLTIPSSVTRAFYSATFQLKKHSPEILAVAGTVGIVASGVMACKATLKVNDILEETKETVEKIHECSENESLAEKYTPEDAKKDLTVTYVQTGVKLAKLYGPSIALGVVSLGSILASNHILRKRNVALAAAYATLDRGFKDYRNRVIERFGETVDRELKYNIKAKKIEETEIDPETGKEKKVKKTVDVVTDGIMPSPYAKIFDEYCNGWEKDPEANMMFLRAQQQYANDLLVSRGYLFLNEVYKMLGILETQAGQIVGWRYRPNDPSHKGDNYVDFGLYDVRREKTRDFVNGYERSVILDFNVDGDILGHMPR